MKSIISLFLTLSFFSSCTKEDVANYLHASKKNPPREQSNHHLLISDLNLSAKINIMFVIDNSYSMNDIQQAVKKNTKLFMDEFIKYDYIDWRMALISTDNSDDPYIGMQAGDILDNNSSDPVGKFMAAVSKLGVNGDASEYIFSNVEDKIRDNPDYMLDDSHLAVIMVTDEEEQSRTPAKDLVEFLGGYVPAHRIIRFYGALNTYEDCNNSWLRYKNSPFEDIINLTEGFMVPTCVSNFGVRLAEIGADIRSFVEQPKILLGSRPKVETIKVLYEGGPLRGGRKEDNSVWFYDEYFNTINFYHLNFSGGNNDGKLHVTYEIDDGYDRDWEDRNFPKDDK